MDIRPVSDDYSVSGQIAAKDVAEIAAAGYKTIVCHRPDHEDGAVPHDEIERAAQSAGLEFRYVPVVSGRMTGEDVDEMAKVLAEAPGPVFGYCRSGARSTNIYMAARQAKP